MRRSICPTTLPTWCPTLRRTKTTMMSQPTIRGPERRHHLLMCGSRGAEATELWEGEVG